MRYEFFKVGNKTVGYDITLDESISRSVFSYLITFALFILIGSVLGTIVPSILSIIYLFNTNRTAKLTINAIAGIMALFFVIDYTQGWICYNMFDSFKSDKTYLAFVIINSALFITHLAFFFDNVFLKENKNEKNQYLI